MIYARGTGDGIAWNGGERETGGRTGGEKKKGGKPQSLRLTSLHL